MNGTGTQFRIPQEPFLSKEFLRMQGPGASSNNGNRVPERYFLFWARNAIYHSLTAASVRAGDEVLVPAYVCKVVPEAVTAYGARAVFYRVGRDCQPDFRYLEQKTGERTRALIAVHYFGFAQPIAQLSEFCIRRRLFLIEDCAHVLQSKAGSRFLGSYGDASVFSLRKFFPLYDGGKLVLNQKTAVLNIDWSHENPLLTLKIVKDIVDQFTARSPGSLAQISYDFVRSIKKPFVRLTKSSGSPGILKVEKTDATFNRDLVNQPMSRMSRMIFNLSDAPAIAARRKSNYLFLQKELAGIDTLEFLMKELPADVCPWVLPLFFKQRTDACAVLRAKGIPATTWDGVRPADLQNALFPDADFLYKNLVFLPVHQCLTEQDLQQIVKAVKEVASCHPSEP
jgi:perosamine synthetase